MSRLGMNHTHDARQKSWVPSANVSDCDFPLHNLPFGVFHRAKEAPRIGVAIGEAVLDLAACFHADLFSGKAVDAGKACMEPALNALMALGQPHWSALRSRLFDLLAEGASEREQVESCLVPMSEAVMELPCRIGDYTDFYASIDHATNVGRMFRPDNPLLPNYKYLPVGYHGRASSIVVSGTEIVRPQGQIKPTQYGPPEFEATRQLDYELELGFFVGQGNRLGERISVADADRRIFGVCLLNDWSARDIQSWEYQPLGPFLAKSFATSISPWIVTMEALEPFRVAAARPVNDPVLLPHLHAQPDRERGGLDVDLQVQLLSETMRRGGAKPHRLSRGNFSQMYWTPAQMLAHHASNGCNLRSGDLLGSGTVSGPEKDSRGCLLEITERGSKPVTLPNGEQRSFLLNGDEILLTGRCEREGFAGLGFGQCAGRIRPAR